MIELLVGVLFLVIILYVVKLIMDMVQLPANVKQIIWIIVAVIMLLMFLQYGGLYDIDLGR